MRAIARRPLTKYRTAKLPAIDHAQSSGVLAGAGQSRVAPAFTSPFCDGDVVECGDGERRRIVVRHSEACEYWSAGSVSLPSGVHDEPSADTEAVMTVP